MTLQGEFSTSGSTMTDFSEVTEEEHGPTANVTVSWTGDASPHTTAQTLSCKSLTLENVFLRPPVTWGHKATTVQ